MKSRIPHIFDNLSVYLHGMINFLSHDLNHEYELELVDQVN